MWRISTHFYGFIHPFKEKTNILYTHTYKANYMLQVYKILQEKTMEFETRIESLTQENKELIEALENERSLVKILREKVDKCNLLCDESKAEVNHLNSMVTEMQHDFLDIQRKFDK